MDRNKNAFCVPVFVLVALRKESVDRNVYCDTDSVKYLGSLSARRAWIEILFDKLVLKLITKSLSARRAWIEISFV